MNWFESSIIRWSLPAALTAAWGLRMSMGGGVVTLFDNVIGVGSLLALLTVLLWKRDEFIPLWDEHRGLLSVIRSWTIEVSSARLIDKIPQGIDLTHNAKRVLLAMGARYRDEAGGNIHFIVCRPLDNGPTRVGFVVSRKRLRTMRTYQELESAAELVRADAEVLESAMHSAYPHTPIVTADQESLILIKTGGVGSIARSS